MATGAVLCVTYASGGEKQRTWVIGVLWGTICPGPGPGCKKNLDITQHFAKAGASGWIQCTHLRTAHFFPLHLVPGVETVFYEFTYLLQHNTIVGTA